MAKGFGLFQWVIPPSSDSEKGKGLDGPKGEGGGAC